MRMLSSIHKADVIEKILDCIGETTTPPELRPARGPPSLDLYEFDWSTQDWGC